MVITGDAGVSQLECPQTSKAAQAASVALGQASLYGQCGGQGWTGPTTCAQGVCTYSKQYYSQCVPATSGGNAPTTTPTTAPTTAPSTTVKPTSTASSTAPASSSTPALPSSFKWSSSQPLIYPKNDGQNVAALKDPSIIYYNGAYHVFASTAFSSGYNLVYLTFTDFSNAESATFHYLSQTPIGSGYRAAPQVFHFAPQNLWYLVFQDGNAAYSTNTDITNPAGWCWNHWTAPKHFYSTEPSIIASNIGSGSWVDMWTICDSANCHLFSSDDNGHLYRSDTSLANFPNGMCQPVIAMTASKYDLFEASNVYNVGNGKYLLIVECIGSTGHRYFRSWGSTSLTGSWTALAATESSPFAGASNVAFSGSAWTQDISHGEAIRTIVDQTMQLSPCGIRYLYQGEAPGSSGNYNTLPWKLALLTQTNC